MKKLSEMPEFAEADPRAVESFQAQLDELEGEIKTYGMTPDTLSKLSALMRAMPAMGTNLCHKGDGAPAPRWENSVGDVTYITCGHRPQHTEVKS